MSHPALIEALARNFPGHEATTGPEGLAALDREWIDWKGPDGIPDLDDWVRRRSHRLHPTYGLDDQVTKRSLPGPYKDGVRAAEICTVRGRDGLWYVKTGFSLPGSGSWGHFRHPVASEREALEIGVAIVRAKAQRCLDNSRETQVDHKWAARIDAWAERQLCEQMALAI